MNKASKSKSNGDVRSVDALKRVAAVGILGAALPAFAVGLAQSAAAEVVPTGPDNPQPCAWSATPAVGASWLTAQSFSCMEVSYSTNTEAVEPGDIVTYTLKIKAPGNYVYHDWLPLHVSEAIAHLDITSEPTLSAAAFGGAPAPKASLSQIDDGYGIWVEDVAGGGMPDGTGSFDPDNYMLIEVSFTGQVKADFPEDGTVTSWVGEPIRAYSEFDTTEVAAALADPLVGCSTVFVGDTSQPDSLIFGFNLFGDWVVDENAATGPLCASIAAASTPIEPEVPPTVNPTVPPSPVVPEVTPETTVPGTTAPGPELARTGAAEPSWLAAIAAALASVGATLAVVRRRALRKN